MKINLTKDDKEILNRIFYFFGAILLISTGVILLYYFIIPGILSLVNIILAIVKMYDGLDNNFRFLWSAFFLFLGWYVLTALLKVTMKLFEYGGVAISKLNLFDKKK